MAHLYHLGESMFFHIQLIDDLSRPEKRQESRTDHWQYFDGHKNNFVARGATTNDAGDQFLSSVLFVEFDNWDGVQKFIDAEPHNKNGVYSAVFIRRWHKALDRLQIEFPRTEGQVSWYIRGYGKAGMHEKRQELLDANRAYFSKFDENNFITRGPILSDDGKEWQGSANLISLPTRDAVSDFLRDEPYYVNGLYDRIIIEKYKFGGRPGQVV